MRGGIDFVGRFEMIDEHWQKLCETVGLVYKPLPKRNAVSSDLDLRIHRDWRNYYTPELKKIVSNFWEDEIDFFKFTFPEDRA
jgi:hypothetical protein